VATVAAGQSEIGEHPRRALIEHRAIGATGLIAERRGKPALADAGGAADQKVGVVVDPLAFDQRRQKAAVEAARSAIVDVPRRRPAGAASRIAASSITACRVAATLRAQAEAQAIRRGRYSRRRRRLRCRRRPWPCRAGRVDGVGWGRRWLV
jgi:hypothetical protein